MRSASAIFMSHTKANIYFYRKFGHLYKWLRRKNVGTKGYKGSYHYNAIIVAAAVGENAYLGMKRS